MKKILSIAFALAMILNVFGNAALAQGQGLGWFESMDNLQKLKSYSMQQVLSATVAGESEGLSGSGTLKLNMKSVIVNRGAYKTDSKNTVELKLRVAIQGEEKPFDALEANLRLSMISLAEKAAYIRLENLSIGAEGVPEKDLEDYQDFKREFENAIKPALWQWIELPSEYITGQMDQNMGAEFDALNPANLRNELMEGGFKMAIRKAIEDEIAKAEKDESMTKEDAAKARALANRFFETEFFTLKTSTKPGKEEQTSFKLDKKRILEFVQGASEEMGEAISSGNLREIRDALRKLSLSGSYRQNGEFGIFDRLKVNLAITKISELDSLRIGYSSKIGNINRENEILPPAKWVPLEEADLDFLPPASEPDLESEPVDSDPSPNDGL